MRSEEESQRTSLIGMRDKFVKPRTAVKNELHDVRNANGIVSEPETFSSERRGWRRFSRCPWSIVLLRGRATSVRFGTQTRRLRSWMRS